METATCYLLKVIKKYAVNRSGKRRSQKFFLVRMKSFAPQDEKFCAAIFFPAKTFIYVNTSFSYVSKTCSYITKTFRQKNDWQKNKFSC